MTSLQQYLDQAVEVLNRYSIIPSKEEPVSELGELLRQVAHLDEAKILAVSKTLQYVSAFNEMVRENVENISIGHRYETITELFESIRDDSKRLIAQLDDGEIDWKEKVENLWMRLTRGTTHTRFEKINSTFKEVSASTSDQLQKEDEVLNAYIDFRFALKKGEVLSQEVLEAHTLTLETLRTELAEASKKVQEADSSDAAEKSRLQLARDEANRKFLDAENAFQLLKDVAENLNIAYSVGETLITKLKQTHDLKQQVYRRSITFFSTHEHVFTVLDTVYTSQHGLHEATQTAESLKEGVNKGLEDIAELGAELEKAALKTGYGSTVNPASVKKLVDAIVKYQEDSRALISELREESARNAKEIEQVVEEGKERSRQAIQSFQRGDTP